MVIDIYSLLISVSFSQRYNLDDIFMVEKLVWLVYCSSAIGSDVTIYHGASTMIWMLMNPHRVSILLLLLVVYTAVWYS